MGALSLWAGEPPTINPFGRKPSERDDARHGIVKLSDGSTLHGLIYLTRGKRFQVYDQHLQRQREIPLRAIQKVECSIKREWLEKEWRFKEGANDEKIYTGRSYPAREYLHTITLGDGRTITGPLSAIVYVQPKKNSANESPPSLPPKRFLLSKRNKGDAGQDLKALVYVKRIELGGNDE